MTPVSREYAEALFALACEDGSCGETAKALEEISRIFAENPEYPEFLASPNIPKSERVEALEKALKDGVPEHVLSFVCLMCERGRISSFNGAVEEYMRLYNASKGVSTARVISAVELTDAEKAALTAKLEKKSGGKVVLECSVDPSLLGGFVIETDGRIMDGSLKRRLKEIRELMEQ